MPLPEVVRIGEEYTLLTFLLDRPAIRRDRLTVINVQPLVMKHVKGNIWQDGSVANFRSIVLTDSPDELRIWTDSATAYDEEKMRTLIIAVIKQFSNIPSEYRTDRFREVVGKLSLISQTDWEFPKT